MANALEEAIWKAAEKKTTSRPSSEEDPLEEAIWKGAGSRYQPKEEDDTFLSDQRESALDAFMSRSYDALTQTAGDGLHFQSAESAQRVLTDYDPWWRELASEAALLRHQLNQDDTLSSDERDTYIRQIDRRGRQLNDLRQYLADTIAALRGHSGLSVHTR